MPLETVEHILALYPDRYFDMNVRHFCEKLCQDHCMRLSYTWIKTALQGARPVKKGRSRGASPSPARAAAAARDAVALGWKPTSLVPGRSLV